MELWGFGKKAVNSTIGTSNFKPLNSFIEEISNSLLIPKFTKAVIASGSFTIPKDGTYKIIACGAGGTSAVGGGGCAIDQRDYVAGDVLTLTVSGSASAVCSARSLSMTANGTTTTAGATASGGNVANHTGGTSSTTASLRNSNGCGAGGHSSGDAGGNGGVIGGNGYNGDSGGAGGYGSIIGGNAGYTYVSGSNNRKNGGNSGVFGGAGSNDTYPNGTRVAGDGGTGIVGGDGGTVTDGVDTARHYGGNGGNGTLVGGNGGTVIPDVPRLMGSVYASVGGSGGAGGGVPGQPGGLFSGGAGGNSGMGWAIPFKEVKTENWTKGNAIIFIEEV